MAKRTCTVTCSVKKVDKDKTVFGLKKMGYIQCYKKSSNCEDKYNHLAKLN